MKKIVGLVVLCVLFAACFKEQINPNLQACVENYESGNLESAMEPCITAAKSGEERAALVLANIALKHYHFDAVEKFSRPLAIKGNAEAQFLLGAALLPQGESQKEAIGWFEKAVAQGDLRSTEMLAWCAMVGEGMDMDFNKSFELHKKLADQGNATGQLILGFMYFMGTGTEINNDLAYQYWRKAYDQGFVAAVPLIEYVDFQSYLRFHTSFKIFEDENAVDFPDWLRENKDKYLIKKEKVDIVPSMKWFYFNAQRDMPFALAYLGLHLTADGSVKEGIEMISKYDTIIKQSKKK